MPIKTLDRPHSDSAPDQRVDLESSSPRRSIDDPFCILVWKFEVDEGNVRSFQKLHDDSKRQLAEQPKALFQRLTRNGDGFEVHVGLEDSYGVLTHISIFAETLEQMRALGRYHGLDVYGPGDELALLREPLRPLRPRFVEQTGNGIV